VTRSLWQTLASFFRALLRLELGLVGVALLAATLFADVFALRDLMWFIRKVHLRDVQPWESIGVLVVSPWLVLVAWRLIVGRYVDSEPPSLGGHLVFGIGVIGLAALAYLGLPILAPPMIPLLAGLGLFAMWLAWRRYRNDRGPVSPNKR
jgi:hypothetical protein